MKTFIIVFKRGKTYYWSCLTFLVLALSFILFYPKTQGFMILNSYHSDLLTRFFSGFTFLGNGIFSLCLAVVFYLLKRKKLALSILAAYLVSGLASQLLKNIVYAPRPKIFFSSGGFSYWLDVFSVSGHGSSSFPSGHSASAFALSTVLAIYYRNRTAGVLFALAAILVAYSRIYLAEHFQADVWAGSFLGILSGTLAVVLINNYSKTGIFRRVSYPTSNYPLQNADAALN